MKIMIYNHGEHADFMHFLAKLLSDFMQNTLAKYEFKLIQKNYKRRFNHGIRSIFESKNKFSRTQII